jgi:hypothetical protein
MKIGHAVLADPCQCHESFHAHKRFALPDFPQCRRALVAKSTRRRRVRHAEMHQRNFVVIRGMRGHECDRSPLRPLGPLGTTRAQSALRAARCRTLAQPSCPSRGSEDEFDVHSPLPRTCRDWERRRNGHRMCDPCTDFGSAKTSINRCSHVNRSLRHRYRRGSAQHQSHSLRRSRADLSFGIPVGDVVP